jgi:hypothetical protein
MATRFDQQLADEEATVIDGDAGFTGMNSRLSAELLQPGWTTYAENVEFRDGAASTRRGSVAPGWLRTGAVLLGAAMMRHPLTSAEGIVLATTTGALWCLDGCPPEVVPTPSAPSSRVRFTQEFGRIVAYRDGLEPWVWESGAGFQVLPRVDEDDGTRPIPLASHAAMLNDRALVPADANQLDIGDIGELGKFGITNRVRLDTGRGDSIVRVFPFTKDAALVFKSRSIFMVSGIAGDLSGLRADVVNAELGCVALDSVASTGGDVLFLSGTGVYRVRQVVQERIETAPRAESYDIEPTLRGRVNWKAIAGATAAVWGERYFLAVPIDAATTNNAVFVLNLVTGAWEGIHVFPFVVDALFCAEWNGERRLFAATFSEGKVTALYEGEEDLGESAINGRVITRGYLCGHATRKRFAVAQTSTSEWYGQSAVSVSVDGNAESQSLYPIDIARDRTKATIAGVEWDATNADNDHGQSGREDYAVILDPAMVLGTGIVLNRTQDFANRFRMQETGRFCQLTLNLQRGQIAVRGVQVEGTAIDRAFHPAP